MRFASVSAVVALLVGCTATSPRPLPPPRTFPPDAVATVKTPSPRPHEIAAEPAPTERDHYRGLIIAADFPTVLLTAKWVGQRSSSPLWGVPVAVTMPFIHAAYGNVAVASASLTLRVAGYAALYQIARQECAEPQLFCYPLATIVTLGVVMAITESFDAYFARYERSVTPPRKLPVLPSVATTGRDTLLTFSVTL